MTDSQEPEDFASMFEAQGRVQTKKLRMGDKVRAKVIHIAKENVFFEVSASQEAVMNKVELTNDKGELTVKLGDTLEAFVVSLGDSIQLTQKLGRDSVNIDMLIEAAGQGIPVEGTVTGVNKGGLDVQLGGGARGFCPIGQADAGFLEDATVLVGKTLSFLVRDVKENGRNVILSRRALLEREREVQAKELLKTLVVGARLNGTVTRLAAFGAFVDLGGVDGLIPISEMAFSRVKNVEDVLSVGDNVTVDVLRVEDDPKSKRGTPRIALSLKATLEDPFTAHLAKLHDGAQLSGKVEKIETYGAFVELFDGVTGLVHISEMSLKRVRHPSDLVSVGQEVSVRVLSVDKATHKISLSLKEAGAAPSGPSGKQSGLYVGAQVQGVVDRLEKYGVFVTLEGGLGTALLPAAETGTAPGTDLTKAFAMGTQVIAQVVAIDDKGRIKISKKAREASDERAVVEQYNKSSGASASFGTFADLLKKKTSK